MSWKSLVTATLLCVVASPALAAPTLTTTGSRLNKTPVPANAVRVWNIAVAPDTVLDPSTSFAVELGFRATGGNILSISAAQNTPARIEVDNPGNVVFGWEALTDVDPGAGTNMKPVGVQLGTGANADEAVAFLGSNLFTTNTRKDILTITTQASVTSLAWGGAYNANGTLAAPGTFVNGLIAQGDATPGGSSNFTSFVGSLSADAAGTTRFLADMNGDGSSNFGDLAGFGQALTNPAAYTTAFPHLNRIGRCDANGDGACNFGDLTGFGQILTGGGAGAGLEVASVPEPSSFILGGMVLALFAVFRRRHA